VPRSKARFLPDSLVGSITIEVGGEQAVLFFLADEEDRQAQKKIVPPTMTKTIKELAHLLRRLLPKKGD